MNLTDLLTGKCLVDFQKWYNENYLFSISYLSQGNFSFETDGCDICGAFGFDQFPSSMQWGVLIDFFDFAGYDLNDYKDSRHESRIESVKLVNLKYNKGW